MLIICFWVSGKYKGKGYGKVLLQHAIEEAKNHGKNGLVTAVEIQKFHFISDTKWLLKQGFETCDTTSSGFSLLVIKLNDQANTPTFNDAVKTGECGNKNELAAYYSNRCPFSEYHVTTSLTETEKQKKYPTGNYKAQFD